jgi:hypothetical protein
MKHIKLLLLFLASWVLFTPAIAQKILQEKATYSYIQQPLKPLPTHITTCRTIITSRNVPIGKITATKVVMPSGVRQYSYTDMTATYENQLAIAGLQKSASGEIYVDLIVDNIYRFDSEIQPTVVRDGKKFFSTKFKYRFPVKLVVSMGSRGQKLLEIDLPGYEPDKVRNSGVQVDDKTVNSSRMQDTHGFDIMDEHLPKIMRIATNILQSYFGRPEINKVFNVYAATSKKADYSDTQTIQKDLLAAISKANKKDETVSTDLQLIAQQLEDILKDANPDNKKVRINKKVMGELYYNLTLTYLLLEDFEKAKQAAQKTKDYMSSVRVGGFLKGFVSSDVPETAAGLEDLVADTHKRYLANN